jgi:hypothetical protein
MALPREELIALLDWYVAAGVDGALDEDPVDRFLETVRETEERTDRKSTRLNSSHRLTSRMPSSA